MERNEIEIKQISSWIIKSKQGSLSLEEQEELAAWRHRSPEHERLYRKLEDEFCLRKNYERYRSAMNIEGWRQIQQKIGQKPGSRFKWMSMVKYAASIVLVFIAGYLFRGISLQEKRKTEVVEIADVSPGSSKAILELADGRQIDLSGKTGEVYLKQQGIHHEETGLIYHANEVSAIENHILRVPPGGEYKLTLEDGTQVWLNSATVLHYPNSFSGNERCVSVEGEAYFKVAKDLQNPFVVKTSGLSICVTGTEFNIMAYQNEKKIETTLVRGGVEILCETDRVILQPGYRTVYSKEDRRLTTQKVNTSLYTSWKDGIFEFEDMTLEEICRQLSRWYDVDIRFETPELASIRFTGAVKKEKSIGFILNVIGDTKAVTYDIHGKNILLKKK